MCVFNGIPNKVCCLYSILYNHGGFDTLLIYKILNLQIPSWLHDNKPFNKMQSMNSTVIGFYFYMSNVPLGSIYSQTIQVVWNIYILRWKFISHDIAHCSHVTAYRSYASIPHHKFHLRYVALLWALPTPHKLLVVVLYWESSHLLKKLRITKIVISNHRIELRCKKL